MTDVRDGPGWTGPTCQAVLCDVQACQRVAPPKVQRPLRHSDVDVGRALQGVRVLVVEARGVVEARSWVRACVRARVTTQVPQPCTPHNTKYLTKHLYPLIPQHCTPRNMKRSTRPNTFTHPPSSASSSSFTVTAVKPAGAGTVPAAAAASSCSVLQLALPHEAPAVAAGGLGSRAPTWACCARAGGPGSVLTLAVPTAPVPHT